MATAAEVLNQQVSGRWQEVFLRFNRDAPGITGLLGYTEAWNLAISSLRPADLNQPESKPVIEIEPLLEAYNLLMRSRRLSVLLETFFEDMRKSFPMIEKDINEHMSEYERSLDTKVILALIYRIEDWYKFWSPPQALGGTIAGAYSLTFQTLLFSALPLNFGPAFKALCASYLPPQEESLPDEPLKPMTAPWNTFEALGLMDRYESTLASVLYEYIEKYILDTCAQKWDEPMEPRLMRWMKVYVEPWLTSLYARGGVDPSHTVEVMTHLSPRFEFHLHKTLCELRIKEIFDIIVDYPDSHGALQDLKTCLHLTDQRGALVSALRKANRRRLLHPGADTKIILAQYVQTIKCLRIIDPPGVLLFRVADPIRRYLRERPDTIRSIVANLVGDDDGGDALVDESEPVQPLHAPELEDYLDPYWEPEPLDAGPQFRANKPSDVISTLVSIYDSKDLFVKELQVLLAQRLLAIGEEGTDKVEKERRNIEILKIRFGEAALQVCEVMLRDMTDSKRIDTHVQSKKSSVVHPTIISKHFWPALDSSDLVMPGQFEGMLDAYDREFIQFKPDKKLRWLPHLGTVHLELELQDRVLDLTVPPLEAALIEQFSTKNVMTLSELVEGVGSVDKSAALKALTTWIDYGVLKEDTEGTFRLLEVAEEASPSTKDGSRAVAVTVAEAPAVSAAQQQEIEQMKMYWQYIQGALRNIGQLPLDRIQSLLKFAPGYDKTIDELGMLMESARREGLVSSKDGMWKLE